MCFLLAAIPTLLTSQRLCVGVRIFFHSATLYQSPNGRFFVVENDAADTITVKVLSKSDAKTFMDEHPAGIFTENYIRIFGQPKQG